MRKIGLMFVAMCMTVGLTLSIASVSCAVEDPDTAETTQELGSPCKGGDGLIVHCHYSSTYDSCESEGACGGSGGYCQETNGTEMLFCSQLNNCPNPNYHTYCTWGPYTYGSYQGCGGYVKDPSAYLHNCISGLRP